MSAQPLFSRDSLLKALLGKNCTVTLKALAEIDGQPPNQGVLSVLDKAISQLPESVGRFQIEKSRHAMALALAGKTLELDPEHVLSWHTQPDRWLDLVVAVSKWDPARAITAIPLLTAIPWPECAPSLLPTLCLFFRTHGTPADAPLLIGLCRHPDPFVVKAAFSALEVLDPTNLQALATPLLDNTNPEVAALAMAALYRWTPRETVRRFVSLLFSSIPAERELALAQAGQFPFFEVESHLVRFISEVEDAGFLNQAGAILREHIHPELPYKIYRLCRHLKGNHQERVRGMVIGLIQAMRSKGQLKIPFEEFFEQLKERLQEEGGRIGPSLLQKFLEGSEEKEAQKKRLEELQAEPGLRATAVESAGIRLRSAATPSPTPASFKDYRNMELAARVDWLFSITENEFAACKADLIGLLSTGVEREKAAVIRCLGRCGSGSDAELVRPFLRGDDPLTVGAAIDSLLVLDSEYLSVYLPALMQSSSGKIRLVASRALCNMDQQGIQSLVEGMLKSADEKKRAIAISASILVDFTVIRNPFLRAFAFEKTPRLLEKMGAVICANPDRDAYREVFRVMKKAVPSIEETLRSITRKLTESLAVALEQTSSSERLWQDEEAGYAADEAREHDLEQRRKAEQDALKAQAAAAARVPVPIKDLLLSEAEPPREQRSKMTTAFLVIGFCGWMFLLATLMSSRMFGSY